MKVFKITHGKYAGKFFIRTNKQTRKEIPRLKNNYGVSGFLFVEHSCSSFSNAHACIVTSIGSYPIEKIEPPPYQEKGGTGTWYHSLVKGWYYDEGYCAPRLAADYKFENGEVAVAFLTA